MKKFMIFALTLTLVSAALTGCGCSANISGTTEPSTVATTEPTSVPTTVPTNVPTTAPTTPSTTAPTVPSSLPTQPATEDTMPGIIDGTSGEDGTIATDGQDGMDPARHGRGMRRG